MVLCVLQADWFMPFPVRDFDYRGKWLKIANLAVINRPLNDLYGVKAQNPWFTAQITASILPHRAPLLLGAINQTFMQPA